MQGCWHGPHSRLEDKAVVWMSPPKLRLNLNLKCPMFMQYWELIRMTSGHEGGMFIIVVIALEEERESCKFAHSSCLMPSIPLGLYREFSPTWMSSLSVMLWPWHAQPWIAWSVPFSDSNKKQTKRILLLWWVPEPLSLGVVSKILLNLLAHTN